MKSEFDFIETMRLRYDLKKIGDDCAVLPKNSESDQIISTDLLIEDIDFRLSWTTPEFLGHKALAVSLSDIAAMGGNPVWSMISVGVPEKIWKTDFVEKFYDGYMHLARRFGVELIGGDISKTPDKIVFDSIVAGETVKGGAVLRSGAKPGDHVFVTGTLGGAAAGLKILESGLSFDDIASEKLLRRQLTPQPQTAIGRMLGNKKLASSMIDISDGLSSDLSHLCRSSGVGAEISAGDIPFDKNIDLLTNSFAEKLNFALNGGEDYELLFTVSPSNLPAIFAAIDSSKIKKIGEILDFADGLNLIVGEVEDVGDVGEQSPVKIEANGFRHF